jgi:hypothetical protein
LGLGKASAATQMSVGSGLWLLTLAGLVGAATIALIMQPLPFHQDVARLTPPVARGTLVPGQVQEPPPVKEPTVVTFDDMKPEPELLLRPPVACWARNSG